MSGQESPAAELRRAFDAGFAAPAEPRSRAADAFLAIRVGKEPYAVRIGQVQGLVKVRKIVPFPSRLEELVGLAGVRGKAVPVYDLGAFLGHPRAGRAHRWLLLCEPEGPQVGLIALAFDDFEGYLEAARPDVRPDAGPEFKRDHVDQVLRTERGTRAVVNIPSIGEGLRGRLKPLRLGE